MISCRMINGNGNRYSFKLLRACGDGVQGVNFPLLISCSPNSTTPIPCKLGDSKHIQVTQLQISKMFSFVFTYCRCVVNSALHVLLNSFDNLCATCAVMLLCIITVNLPRSNPVFYSPSTNFASLPLACLLELVLLVLFPPAPHNPPANSHSPPLPPLWESIKHCRSPFSHSWLWLP